jgi:hypothetical protein
METNMFMIRPRFGFGFDVEHNEDIIYRVHFEDEDGEESMGLLCYNGFIMKLPFCTVYVGDFMDLKELVDAENSNN